MTPKYIYTYDNPLFDDLTGSDAILTAALEETINRAQYNKRINPDNFNWNVTANQDEITVTGTPKHQNHLPLNRYSPYIAPRLYAAHAILERKYTAGTAFNPDNLPTHIKKHLPELIHAKLVIIEPHGIGRFYREDYKIAETPYNDPCTNDPRHARTSELYQCDYCGTMQRATTTPDKDHDGFYLTTSCLVCNTIQSEYYGKDY